MSAIFILFYMVKFCRKAVWVRNPENVWEWGKVFSTVFENSTSSDILRIFTTKSKQNIYNDKYFQIFEQNIGEIGKLIEQ